MNKPYEIQLSLQGGGAKLVYLMAALGAVRKLEDEGHIKVVRLSGTSAGSLAACLYASRKRWDLAEALVKDMANEVSRQFVIPSKFKIAWNLFFRNQPIWSENTIRKSLDSFFGPSKKITELDIPVIIISSNLTTGSEHVHTGNEGITDSIMDSCGIPFFFRHVCQRVDGGLCSNLPVLQLCDDLFSTIPTVALSFPSTHKPSPSSPLDFVARLIDISIDSGVSQAKDLADFVCDVTEANRLNIGTLDFEAASAVMGSDTYEFIKTEVRSKFVSNIIPIYPNIVNKKQRIHYLEESLMEAKGAVYKIYKSQLKSKRMISFVKIEVIAHSIADSSMLDDLQVTMRFSSADLAPIRALEFHVEAPFSGRDWILRDADTDKNISLSVFDASDPDFGSASYVTVVIIPDSPLAPGKDYLLTIRESCDCFEGLRKKDHDELFYKPHDFDGEVGEVEFVIHYPTAIDVTIADHKELPSSFERITIDKANIPAGFSATGARSCSVGKEGFGIRVLRVGR